MGWLQAAWEERGTSDNSKFSGNLGIEHQLSGSTLMTLRWLFSVFAALEGALI
jgi:hypothetical protein